MTESNGNPRIRLEECVVAAIEAGAKLRGPEGRSGDPVERTVAMVESEAARLRGNDFSALSAVLAGQALALDTIFTELAKEAVEGNIVVRDHLRLALKAQSQSRATLESLLSFARPSGPCRARNEKMTNKLVQTGIALRHEAVDSE